MSRKSRRPFPKHSLEEALVVAEAINRDNAGKKMKKLLVANSLDVKPSSTNFRDILSSSYKYGLTLGTEKADHIELTELGKKIVQPLSPEIRIESLQEAALTPDTFKNVYTHYKDNRFPSGQYFENALEVEFKVPREYVKELSTLLNINAKYSGILRDISGSAHIMFENFTPVPEEPVVQELKSDNQLESSDISLPKEDPVTLAEDRQKSDKPKPIFIAHGKNKLPLDQLKKVLDQFKIPYKIAMHEPNTGRPISQKVREIMQECGSAIFIFTSDRESVDDQWGTIPNLNVVFELGAASALYGDKIIIFKEGEINLPSDFNNIGYIQFEKDQLDTKTLDLFKELIAMGFVKVTPA